MRTTTAHAIIDLRQPHLFSTLGKPAAALTESCYARTRLHEIWQHRSWSAASAHFASCPFRLNPLADKLSKLHQALVAQSPLLPARAFLYGEARLSNVTADPSMRENTFRHSQSAR
jgi:hypothetical protein